MGTAARFGSFRFLMFDFFGHDIAMICRELTPLYGYFAAKSCLFLSNKVRYQAALRDFLTIM
ncbi:hypothetical protein GCM10011502_16390 [Oceanisphaera marina]|uniref:Uncharacterized protein n=1 Tax=Oceanisphaera marina TaxID=2017550 RepID=A0ABQ1IJF6_9GAMM|nr:hypothetical protein GCM10011502_16390 [Oceanisphaera marina]